MNIEAIVSDARRVLASGVSRETFLRILRAKLRAEAFEAQQPSIAEYRKTRELARRETERENAQLDDDGCLIPCYASDF